MRPDVLARGLKLQHLRVLTAVANCGSMGKAARQLSLSQPVISKVIADLEAMLGVALFDRSRHGVDLTMFGRALLNRSSIIFDNLKTTVDEIMFLADPSSGVLSFGGTDHLLAGIGAAVMDRMWQEHSGISFQVVHADFETLTRRDLPERRIEFAIVPLLTSSIREGLKSAILFEDHLRVTVGKKSPLANRRRITLADLRNEPWCLTPSPIGSLIFDAFQANNLGAPHVAVSAASAQVSLQMVETGRFVGHFGHRQLSFFERRFAVKRLPIDLPVPPFKVAILTLHDRMLSPLAERFISCAFAITKSFADKAKDSRPSRSKS